MHTKTSIGIKGAKLLHFICATCGTESVDYASNRKKSKSGKYFCSTKCRGIGLRVIISIANGGDGVLRTKQEKDALYYRKNTSKIRQRANNYYNNNRNRILTRNQIKDRMLKREVLGTYGGKCQCCGESHIEFLTIDHINGDGAEHRARCGKGRKIYADIKKRGFPKDKYRCLCLNCNISLGFYGYCPHRPLLRRKVDKRPKKNPGRKRTVKSQVSRV